MTTDGQSCLRKRGIPAAKERPMGMDVFGVAPTSTEGEYFRRNVWGWRPIANFIIETQPEIAGKVKRHQDGEWTAPPGETTQFFWGTNDGYGLDAEWSVKLADALDKMLADGAVEAYVQIRDAGLARMPSVTCDLCDGTGQRDFAKHPSLDRKTGTGTCNKCEGVGSVRPHDTWYWLTVDDIRAFSAFARASGGFEIC